MTREERIDWLCRLRCWVVAPPLMTAEQKSKFIEALTETIEALQTEHCEDAISRAEAMNALDALYLDGESAQGFTADANEDCLIGKYKAIEILDELPSVQPKPKKGYISIADVMSVFDDFMCGDVDEDGTETFLEMLKDKAESEDGE